MKILVFVALTTVLFAFVPPSVSTVQAKTDEFVQPVAERANREGPQHHVIRREADDPLSRQKRTKRAIEKQLVRVKRTGLFDTVNFEDDHPLERSKRFKRHTNKKREHQKRAKQDMINDVFGKEAHLHKKWQKPRAKAHAAVSRDPTLKRKKRGEKHGHHHADGLKQHKKRAGNKKTEHENAIASLEENKSKDHQKRVQHLLKNKKNGIHKKKWQTQKRQHKQKKTAKQHQKHNHQGPKKRQKRVKRNPHAPR